MSDVSANVKAALPVVTPFTVSDSEFNIIWPIVSAKYSVVVSDNTIDENIEIEAKTFLLAHFLALRDGKAGISAESIGDYSYRTSKDIADSYYEMFEIAVKTGISGKQYKADEFSPGFDNYDVDAADSLKLDQVDIDGVITTEYEP